MRIIQAVKKILSNQDQRILGNQTAIKRLLQEIVRNQGTIIANQKRILRKKS